ncbi:MAG: hypothetical protein HN350_00960 [Phycisphaerales bacterium]|jgi:hypothetical protein|nr:hypothetical protein [Phycisphaerales bacterium]
MKKFSNAALSAALLLAACGVAWGAAKKPPPEPEPNGTIKLRYDAIGASRATTPSIISGGNRFSVGSSSSMGIKVAGKSVKTSAKVTGRNFYLGFDRNGDGKIAKSEWALIPSSGTMRITGKSGDISYSMTLTKMRVSYNKKTVSCWGQAIIRSSMAGRLHNIPVRILDDNMDGKFTQNKSRFSSDAIMIGSSPSAIPLRKTHRIGKHIYQLTVAADGTSIDYKRVDDAKLGRVITKFSSSMLKSLVLVGSDSAYDIKTDGLAGIPAGDYKLAYGLIGRGSKKLSFKPSTLTPDYPITADMVNTLRIGPPARVDFDASYRGGKVQLSAYDVKVLGAGSEIYGPIDFTRKGNTKPPQIIILNGRKIASSSSMKYG